MPRLSTDGANNKTLDDDVFVLPVTANTTNSGESKKEQKGLKNYKNGPNNNLTHTFLKCSDWLMKSMKPRPTFRTYVKSLERSPLTSIVAKPLHPSKIELNHNIPFQVSLSACLFNKRSLATILDRLTTSKNAPLLLLFSGGRTPGRASYVECSAQRLLMGAHKVKRLSNSQRLSFVFRKPPN